MKKVLVLLVTFFLSITFVSAKCTTKTTIKVFYGDGCPFCKALFSFLDNLSDDYKSCYTLEKYEVWNNKENNELMQKTANDLGVNLEGVPFYIIGDETFSGYNSDYNKDILSAIINNTSNDFSKDELSEELKSVTVNLNEGEKKLNKNLILRLLTFAILFIYIIISMVINIKYLKLKKATSK